MQTFYYKCMFSKTSVNFLRHIISERGIETDPEKTRKIQDWPNPSNFKELSSFLGFANYYRRFIKSFSDMATPLLAVSNHRCKKRSLSHGQKKWKRHFPLYKMPQFQAELCLVLTPVTFLCLTLMLQKCHWSCPVEKRSPSN